MRGAASLPTKANKIMSRNAAVTHLRAALSRWPQDVLRPETQLPRALAPRLERLERLEQQQQGTSHAASASGTAIPTGEVQQLREANALLALLDNRFKNRYRVREQTFRPRSAPDYYDNLIRELDEAPTRSAWSRWMTRIKGMVRLE
ncbi:hypothetical protein GGTG_05319 [Gaeumannomyces tritici R3-111a-1]|uniref:Uncharacterized protein n=1 Tax=Gaeumannomyces tritici (strain R3-111a-1) TaxID=644352 RepID=J3NVK4_GAET3|nr:hypothetical protein GGTG_05319 [Gaeumannomyces tritici R3-111a-1]EJT75382.1 hypothetical protein GGTG_05319 [Gaeumannomyces tritici R3-111a-1]